MVDLDVFFDYLYLNFANDCLFLGHQKAVYTISLFRHFVLLHRALLPITMV